MLYCPCVKLRGQGFSGTAWCLALAVGQNCVGRAGLSCPGGTDALVNAWGATAVLSRSKLCKLAFFIEAGLRQPWKCADESPAHSPLRNE